MIRKNRISWWAIVLVAIALIVVLAPLTRPGFFVSDDGEWMVIRLTAFYQSLREGQFPVRFLGRLNHSYGYPVANFLYPGFLYIGSLLRYIGFSYVESIKLILFGSVVGAAVFLFLWLRSTYSQVVSAVATIGFVFSPYVVYDLYVRGSVGEILALLCATAGLYALSRKNVFFVALSTGGLIVSHNSLAILFFIVFVLYAIRIRAYALVPAFALGLGMSSFFWVPALFEKHLVYFDAVRVSDPAGYFATGQLWWLVSPAIVCAFILYMAQRGGRSTDLFAGIFVISTALALPLSIDIWQTDAFAKLFQFPYRMLAVSAVCGAWVVAAALDSLRTNRAVWVAAFFLLLQARYTLPIVSNVEFIERPESYYATNEGTTTVANEYLPRWVVRLPQHRPVSKVEFVAGGGTIVARSERWENIDMEISSSSQTQLQINTIYYPGWKVAIDGVPVKVRYDNPEGLMRVEIPSGRHRLQTVFRETGMRFMADVVTFVSTVLTVLLLRPRVRRKIRRVQ